MAARSRSKYSSFSRFQEANDARAFTEAGVRDYISNKAAQDAAFRKALVADALGTVEAELGITMPSGLKLVVHQEANDELHLVLPAPLELTPQQLEQVSAGWPGADTASATTDDAFFDADAGQDYY